MGNEYTEEERRLAAIILKAYGSLEPTTPDFIAAHKLIATGVKPPEPTQREKDRERAEEIRRYVMSSGKSEGEKIRTYDLLAIIDRMEAGYK